MTTDLVPIDGDLDIAARLVLLDPAVDLIAFIGGVGISYSLSRAQTNEIWTRYRGWDSRTSPTHDIDTGKRLR